MSSLSAKEVNRMKVIRESVEISKKDCESFLSGACCHSGGCCQSGSCCQSC